MCIGVFLVKYFILAPARLWRGKLLLLTGAVHSLDICFVTLTNISMSLAKASSLCFLTHKEYHLPAGRQVAFQEGFRSKTDPPWAGTFCG